MEPAGILKNASTGRFHPIVFRFAPAPSSTPDEKVQRYKSRGHHTEGFDTEEEAKDFIGSRSEQFNTGAMWEWSGDGIPAMVQWFEIPATAEAQ